MSRHKGTLHFQKCRRILKSFEFETVFNKNQLRASNQHLLVLAYQSENVEHQQEGRLGLVVGKKNLARAVDRNRIKRITREVFRQRITFQLKNLDVLLIARKGLASMNNQEIQQHLLALFNKIEKQAHKRNAIGHE